MSERLSGLRKSRYYPRHTRPTRIYARDKYRRFVIRVNNKGIHRREVIEEQYNIFPCRCIFLSIRRHRSLNPADVQSIITYIFYFTFFISYTIYVKL